MKIKVGVIFGGRSGEHEISVRSAKTVIEQINKERYEIFPIAVGKDGKWLGPRASIGLLPPELSKSLPDTPPETDSIALIGDPRYQGIVNLDGSAPAATIAKLDVVFPVLHGTYGEDGTIQGLLEMADIPYVGCGVLASACGMDKTVMKMLFREAGIPICKYLWFLRKEFEQRPERTIALVRGNLGFPCFVKPANLGSSVGVSRANDEKTLYEAIVDAAKYDRKIVVEEALKMREIECSVIGNDEPEASLPGEYLIRNQDKAFLDYTEKYSGTGNNQFVAPAPVSEELSTKIRSLAVRAFKAVDGSGLARVDFFLRSDTGELLVNEINTMPGLTDASGFPKMWAGSGLDFAAVIEKLIDLAIERHKDNSRNVTSLN
ncbi:MAG: D-alanine--D-alanine ligase family protein [Pyrinomonadaceae bacterium]